MSRQTRTGLGLVAVVNQNEHDRPTARRFRNRLVIANGCAWVSPPKVPARLGIQADSSFAACVAASAYRLGRSHGCCVA